MYIVSFLTLGNAFTHPAARRRQVCGTSRHEEKRAGIPTNTSATRSLTHKTVTPLRLAPLCGPPSRLERSRQRKSSITPLASGLIGALSHYIAKDGACDGIFFFEAGHLTRLLLHSLLRNLYLGSIDDLK